MNERIKQIAEKAGLGDGLDEGAGIISLYAHFDLEKFAELLLNECIEITSDCSTGNTIHDLFADEIIAEHFGIE